MAASHRGALELRRTRRTASVDPMAMPEMNEAAMRAKAYVVGPTTNASRRAHATSKTSAASPDSAAAVAASVGRASPIVADTERGRDLGGVVEGARRGAELALASQSA